MRYFTGLLPLLKVRTLPCFLYEKLPNNPSYYKSDALYAIYLIGIYYIIDLKINFRYNYESVFFLLNLLRQVSLSL